MARFPTSLSETFYTDHPPEVVAAWFADRQAIQRATKKAQRFEEPDDNRLRFYLKPQNHGVTTFEGRYTVEYTHDGTTTTWTTVGDDNNLWNTGSVRCREEGGRTRVDFQNTIEIELPVGRLMKRVVAPLVDKMGQPSLRRYVENMLADLDAHR